MAYDNLFYRWLSVEELECFACKRTSANRREELSKQIPASVAWIYRYWLPYRQAVYEQNVANTIQRSHPKIGRNDPCPWGSGLKFKKCCGVAASLH